MVMRRKALWQEHKKKPELWCCPGFVFYGGEIRVFLLATYNNYRIAFNNGIAHPI